MIMPGTLSTITAVFPADKRARAVSIWAGFASSGAILGLLTCGLILEWFTWRATFVATACLAAVTFVVAAVLTPNTADPEETMIDLPGYLLSGVGIGGLIFGIIDGAEAGWATTSAVLGFAVAAVSLTSFVLWQLRTTTPMLDVRLFRLRGFSTGTLGLTVQFLCLFGFFLVGLQFLQLMLGYSALRSALCLLPMAAIVMPMSRVAPHLVERLGQRAVMSFGLSCLGVGLGILSQLDAESTYWHFLGGLAVFGLGMAFTSTPATTAIVTSLPRAKQGIGSAVNDLSREFGSALGIAILGSLFNSGYSSAVGTRDLAPTAGRGPRRRGVGWCRDRSRHEVGSRRPTPGRRGAGCVRIRSRRRAESRCRHRPDRRRVHRVASPATHYNGRAAGSRHRSHRRQADHCGEHSMTFGEMRSTASAYGAKRARSRCVGGSTSRHRKAHNGSCRIDSG